MEGIRKRYDKKENSIYLYISKYLAGGDPSI